jgi:uncharacterized membrane-anchored protein YhcB (DUF1043 family)
MDWLGIDPKTLGTGAAAVLALLAIVYNAFKILKQDAKGDKVDDRVNQFTTQLQAQLDKAIARSDKLQVDYNSLQAEFAKVSSQLAVAQARAEFLATQNLQLSTDLQNLRGRVATATGERA